jgi:hypothetical protein
LKSFLFGRLILYYNETSLFGASSICLTVYSLESAELINTRMCVCIYIYREREREIIIYTNAAALGIAGYTFLSLTCTILVSTLQAIRKCFDYF